jgi:hypothetical protein
VAGDTSLDPPNALTCRRWDGGNLGGKDVMRAYDLMQLPGIYYSRGFSVCGRAAAQRDALGGW